MNDHCRLRNAQDTAVTAVDFAAVSAADMVKTFQTNKTAIKPAGDGLDSLLRLTLNR